MAGEAGLTIMEVALVLAIVSLMMVAGTVGLRSLTRADLRSGAARSAASMRYAFDRATMTGTYIRLAFDLDKGRIWAESSEDMITLRSGRDQHSRGAEDEEKDRKEGEGEGEGEEKQGAAAKKKSSALAMLGLGGSDDDEDEDSDDSEASGGIDVFSLTKQWQDDLKPIERPKASFTELSDIVAKKFKLARGIKVAAVITPRTKDAEAQKGGLAYIYFFPQGHAEPAIVHIVNKDEEYYSVVLHPLTGSARVYPCKYKIPEKFGQSDDKRDSTDKVCEDTDG